MDLIPTLELRSAEKGMYLDAYSSQTLPKRIRVANTLDFGSVKL